LTITNHSTFMLAQKGHITQMHILKCSIAVSTNYRFGHCRSNLFEKVRCSKYWVICSIMIFPYQWIVCSFV